MAEQRMIEQPCVEIWGFYPGEKPQTYFFPIIFDEHFETFHAPDSRGLKIMKIKYHWDNKEKDILDMQRYLLTKHREQWKEARRSYLNSRVVRRGRAQADESVIKQFHDFNTVGSF